MLPFFSALARVRGWTRPPAAAACPDSPPLNRYKIIAILLIVKGIAIAFVKYYDYICVAIK